GACATYNCAATVPCATRLPGPAKVPPVSGRNLPVVAFAITPWTNAVVAMDVSLSPNKGVGARGSPVNTGLASSAPPAPVTSMPASVTAPVRPLKLVTLAAGGAAMEDAMVDTTNAVVAMDVSLSPGDGVGALGLPVNVGEASGAPPTDVTSSRLNSTAPVRLLKLTT